jgi:hypothetical protein
MLPDAMEDRGRDGLEFDRHFSTPGPTSTPRASACFIQRVDDDMGHHGPGDLRGDAVQVRLGHRHRPVDPPLEPREARRRRQALGPRQLHADLRRHRLGHQVGRQDPRAAKMQTSRSGTPTSSSSSEAKTKEEKKAQRPDRRRATRPTSTARPTARSSSRTPTSRSATDAFLRRRRGPRRRLADPPVTTGRESVGDRPGARGS